MAGAAAGPLLTFLASFRSPRQPVDADIDAERRLLDSALADVGVVALAEEVTGLEAKHFTTQRRRDLWSHLASHRDNPGNFALLDEAISEVTGAGHYEDYDAATVVECAEARLIYKGAGSTVENVETGELERVYERPTAARLFLGSVISAVGFAVAAFAAGTVSSGWAQVAGTLALVAAVASGYVMSAIDHDTLTLDYLTLAVGGVVGWSAAAWQGFALGEPERLGHGVAAAVIWLVVFTALNFAYRLVRGVDGIGGGDWKIAAVCAAVPAAVAGSFLVGFFAVVAGMFVALAVQAPQLIRGKADRMTRFAMGPYIAIGWPAAWIYVSSQGLI